MYESPATICYHARCAALGACYAGFIRRTARRGRPICAARRAGLLADTLALENGTRVPVASGPGDPTLSEALVQLPPPGHPAATLLEPADPDRPDGTWWSPGNDDRANEVPGALGGPAILDWLAWLWCFLFGWLPWAGC